jgi:hydrogenase nickel incorporation protein HypA/HybF
MHELGLCEGIVDAVLHRARGRRVSGMRVRIGGHVVDDAVLRQGIALSSAGTVAAGAEVDLVLEPMQVRCGGCGVESPVRDHLATVACPRCGGVDVEVIGDEEVILESIVVEAAEGEPAAWTPSSC